MWQACASKPLVVHSPSHGMNTCEPKKEHFADGFYDPISSELDMIVDMLLVLLVFLHDMFIVVLALFLIL
jgi:hypothetical protein